MIQNIRRSLTDLLGAEYTAAVCRARAALTGESPEALRAVADEKVDFYPEAFARRQEELMGDIGHSLAPAFADTEDGAPTHSYRAAQHSFAAPLGGLGAFRIGEDGRLYFAGKSEHYQIPLGHDFPGYSLIENAKRLGIPNATHNNTRGFITRTLERRLIAAANGLQPTDPALDRILSQKEPGVLNTVINLETGSLAVEAALTAEVLGNAVARLYDVGVAGIHRLLAHADDIASAQVVVAVAGMEGALASVVGGLASCPVIAVPTSVGYGASFGGVAALLAMLNSCASGVSVVNIDNGFGAGYQASAINHLKAK